MTGDCLQDFYQIDEEESSAQYAIWQARRSPLIISICHFSTVDPAVFPFLFDCTPIRGVEVKTFSAPDSLVDFVRSLSALSSSGASAFPP